MKKSFIIGLTLLALIAVPAAATFAQTGKCDPSSEQGIQCPLDESKFGSGPSFFIDLLDKVSNWMFTFLLVAAVIFIVYAAYNYLLSEGSEEKVAAAHKMLIFAAVAVAVALLSRGFVFVIKQTVGGANPAGTPAATDNGSQDGGNQNANGNDTNQPAIQWSGISTFTVFPVQVQVCTDGKIPGARVVSDETDDSGNQLAWSNSPDENGHPDIGPGGSNAATAGEWVRVGDYNTSAVGDPLDIITTLGLATDYFFDTETCNNGMVPAIRFSPDNNGRYQYRQAN